MGVEHQQVFYNFAQAHSTKHIQEVIHFLLVSEVCGNLYQVAQVHERSHRLHSHVHQQASLYSYCTRGTTSCYATLGVALTSIECWDTGLINLNLVWN